MDLGEVLKTIGGIALLPVPVILSWPSSVVRAVFRVADLE